MPTRNNTPKTQISTSSSTNTAIKHNCPCVSLPPCRKVAPRRAAAGQDQESLQRSHITLTHLQPPKPPTNDNRCRFAQNQTIFQDFPSLSA
jgi:hypothetical protein